MFIFQQQQNQPMSTFKPFSTTVLLFSCPTTTLLHHLPSSMGLPSEFLTTDIVLASAASCLQHLMALFILHWCIDGSSTWDHCANTTSIPSNVWVFSCSLVYLTFSFYALVCSFQCCYILNFTKKVKLVYIFDSSYCIFSIVVKSEHIFLNVCKHQTWITS